MNIPWAPTAGEKKALAAMPDSGMVEAKRGTPFNGKCMWQLHLKGYVGTPDAGETPTRYFLIHRGGRS